MKITSRCSQKIFWRIFDPHDMVYWVGQAEGTLLNGESTSINLPSGSCQIEIKDNDLFGTILVWAKGNYLYHNSDSLIIYEEAIEVEQNEKIPINGSIQISYSGPFVGDKKETENFSNNLFFYPNNEITLEPFTIKRDAATNVIPLLGTFDKASGNISIPANLTIIYGIFIAPGQILLTSGSVHSPSNKYSTIGSPLDNSNLKATLVGAGSLIAVGLTFEYMVIADITLDRLP